MGPMAGHAAPDKNIVQGSEKVGLQFAKWLITLASMLSSFLVFSTFLAFLGPYLSISFLAAGIGLSLISGIGVWAAAPKALPWVRIPCFYPVVFLGASILLSIIFADPFPYGKSIEKVGYLFSFFPFVWTFYFHPKLKERVLQLVAWLSFLLGIFALAQFLGLLEKGPAFLNHHLKGVPNAPGFYLATGLTFHHTPFAATMLWLFHVLLAHGLLGSNKRLKLIWFAGCLFCLMAILTTFSRGVWLATVISTVLTVGLVNWKRALISILFWCGLIFALFLTIPSFKARIHSYRLGANSERLEVWKVAYRMFQDSPWTGQGYHSFGERLQKFAPELAKDPYFPREAHNMYLDFLATTGLVGLSAFVALLVYWAALLFRGWRSQSITAEGRPWILAAIGGFSAFLVAGCFDRHFYMTQTLTPLLFFMSIATAVIMQESESFHKH